MGFEMRKDLDTQEQQIRQDMEDTRSALTEKLETLEQKVATTVEGVTDTVDSVKDAVQDTVATVKDSVTDTVAAVKDGLNLPLQVERHPWAMVGGSVAAGFFLGRMFANSSREPAGTSRVPRVDVPPPSRARPPEGNGGPEERNGHPDQKAESQPGWLQQMTTQFSPEIAKLKGLALGTLMGLVRDMVQPALSEQLGTQVAELIDNITTKVGGELIRGPVISQFAGHDPTSPTAHP